MRESEDTKSFPQSQEHTQKTVDNTTNDKDRAGQEQAKYARSIQEHEEHLVGLKLLALLIALLLIVLVVALDASIIATAVPRITDEFDTIANVGWYGAAYMLANAALQPLTGKMYTFFPLKTTFFAFVFLFELGSILCATATSSSMLIVGRAVAGMGGSGLAGGSLTLIGMAAPPSQRPTILGVAVSMFSAGQLLGPLVGGALTQHASWRWCFWINLPTGAAAVVGILAVRLPPHSHDVRLTRRNFLLNFDMLGFLLFAPASVMLLLALQWGGTIYSWNSTTIIGLLCGAGITSVIFVVLEIAQGEKAMFPPSLICYRLVAFSLVNAFLHGGALLILGYYLPLWFQVVKHASPTQSAVNTLPTFISQVIFSITSGPLAHAIGFFTPSGIVGAAVSSIGLGLMSTFTPNTATRQWIGYQILAGAGRGLAMQQPVNVIQAILPRAQIPTGMAIVMWSQFLGGSVFLGVAQTTFSALLKAALTTFAPNVDPQSVINAGATDYASMVKSRDLPGVLTAYNTAITKTYYLPTAASAIAALTATGMGWKRILLKAQQKKNDSGVTEQVT